MVELFFRNLLNSLRDVLGLPGAKVDQHILKTSQIHHGADEKEGGEHAKDQGNYP